MLVVVCFSVHSEFSEVIREEVRLRAEIELGENPSHSAEILPHHVFASNLEGLGEVIDLLVLGSLLEVLRLRLTCPHAVPLGAIRPDNPATTCFQRIHH